MKIIFISRYQEKVERGVENYVKELAGRLSKNHEVKVLTSFWQLLRNQKRPGLPAGERPGLNIIYPLNGYWQTFFCRLYAWLTGSKLVVGGHAGIGRDDRWNLYMFPDLFIAFSQKGFEWAKKVNPFVKIVKILHGVNLEQFNPNAKSVSLDLERPRFVVAANLVPYKRVKETVRAVAKLKKGSLLILGDGPLEEEIDKLGNELLRSNKYLRLKVLHSEMSKYLTACDVFTLVSEETEAFGLVYLEALACNLPVVATDDSLRHELVGDAGLFIKNPENSDDYSCLLQEATRKSWKDSPRSQAEKFGWGKIVASYERILDLLGR